jgi:2-polyprenyl-3-methyl-5-hydroxy-6-metoxy-1,4-benzoquinol methylase
MDQSRKTGEADRGGNTTGATHASGPLRRLAKRLASPVTHLVGRVTGRYYFEDYVRVYPGGIAYNRFGFKRRARPHDLKNLQNHMKFYGFAAQFAPGQRVIDVGCGSGYGCKILRDAGAADVHGADVSRHALRFARKHYGSDASFTRQSITDLDDYPDEFGDVVISSEVLEHIKEYGLAGRALDELRRVAKRGGLLIVATPNSELLGEHGFSWDELSSLIAARFDDYCIFENALLPFEPDARRAWEERRASGRTGVIVSERLNLDETVVPDGVTPEPKRGQPPGELEFANRRIDTGRLHNTHSWVALAIPGG